MSIFSRILVGTDGSDASDQAVGFAAKLAQEHASELIVCHFVNWVATASEAAAAGALCDPGLVDELRDAGDAFHRACQSPGEDGGRGGAGPPGRR